MGRGKEKTGKSYHQVKQEQDTSEEHADDVSALINNIQNPEKLILDEMYDPSTRGKYSFAELRAKLQEAREHNKMFEEVKEQLTLLKKQKEELFSARYNFLKKTTGTAYDDTYLQKIDRAEQLISQKRAFLENNEATWKFVRMAELQEYQEQLTRGYVETPSRLHMKEKLSSLLSAHEHIFLEGDSGTGKTQLLRNLVRTLEGYEPDVVVCSDQTKITELLGRDSLRSENGATVSVFKEGMLVRAMVEGKKIIFDEFNNMDSNTRFALKPFYTLKPGDTFKLQQDGEREFTVAEGFGFLATGNLPSEKHPERKPLDPAETREFKMPHLDHLPKEEVYDLLLVASMRKDGSIPFSLEEAQEMLKRLAEAIKDVHHAYEGVGNFYADVVKKEKALLKKAVLDPGEYISWIRDYKKQTEKSFGVFLSEKIAQFASKGDFPESDRNILFKIFATRGLLDGIDPSPFSLDTREAEALGWKAQQEYTKQEGLRNLDLEQIAELDPWNTRMKKKSASIDDFIAKNAPHEKVTSVFETGATTMEEALEIMGESQFLGPQDIENIFGFTPETIPSIPFSPERLKEAKERGEQLILYVDTKGNGSPFTMKDIENIRNNKTSNGDTLLWNTNQGDNWFNNETALHEESPRLAWRLTTPEIIPNSTDKNYIEQIEESINYLQNETFAHSDMPQTYLDAIEQFKNKKAELEELMENDWKQASEELAKLDIVQLTHERLSEILYRLTLNEAKTGTKSLNSIIYTWSSSRSSSARLAVLGYFVSDGAYVSASEPSDRNGYLGLCISVGE